MAGAALTAAFPRALADYPDLPGEPLARVLASRVELEPFNAIATGIFAIAILHTFLAARFTSLAHRVQYRHAERCRETGAAPSPSVLAEVLHFLGEVEVVFGLWAAVLMVAITVSVGWHAAFPSCSGACPLHWLSVCRARKVIGSARLGSFRRLSRPGCFSTG